MIASRLGRVLKIDEFTKASAKGRFARVCVEVDLAQPLKAGIRIRQKNNSFFQTLAYENLPSLCFKCGRDEAYCSFNCQEAKSVGPPFWSGCSPLRTLWNPNF